MEEVIHKKGQKREKGSQKSFNRHIQEELEDTVLTAFNNSKQSAHFDFEKMMDIQRRLARGQAIIEITRQEVPLTLKANQSEVRQLIFSDGEALFKRFDEKVWRSLLTFLDLNSQSNLRLLSKYFGYSIPNYWEILLEGNISFAEDVRRLTVLKNSPKEVYLGCCSLNWIMNKLGYSSNLFSISDIAARASKMILIEYLTALSDVKVIPPTLQGQLSQPCNTKEKDLPYLMISLFPSQQSLSLWKTRLQLVDSGNTKLRLVAGFGFKGESLHPTAAKFFGEERIYVTFEEPSIRFYNLAKLDFLQDFTESERRYEFDLTFEGSILNIRSSYSDKVSIIHLNSPLKETRSWKITMVGENCIMCYEKHSNLIVLLNTTKKQGALYKALQFERESKDIPVIECWVPSHVNEGNKLSIYFIDSIYTIYGLEVEVDRKDSAECEKVACKKIYQPSYPILNNSTKTFEFFKWVKEEPSNKKLQPGVDACIVLVPSKFIIIDLQTGEVKDIALPPKIMPRGWTIVDNVLAYEHNGLIYLSSLYLNSEKFGVSIKGLSLYSSSPNIMQVHFLTFKGVLAIVWESGSNLNVEFLHAYAFDPKLFPASLSKEKIKCETSMDLFTLFGGEPALAEKKMYTIKNSIMLRFSLSKFDTENSFTHYEHAEARNSLILYQRNNAIFFVDIFNKCRQEPRWKGPKDSQNNIDDKSAKLQLVNHKELIPNQNKPVGIVKPKEIPQSQPTKTSLKKELKGVSKTEKAAKIKELTTKEDAVEESKDAHGHQDKAVALNLQKISKAQKVQERNEKKKKNDKSMRAEILNKKSF